MTLETIAIPKLEKVEVTLNEAQKQLLFTKTTRDIPEI